MELLNVPAYRPKVLRVDGKQFVFDPLRQKRVVLTPEEWVRQHFINYLLAEKGYPAQLLANEVTVVVGSTSRRCDTVVYNSYLEPLAIIEYKAPSVPVTRKVFEQIARYNIALRVKHLIVSNGWEHYCCRLNYSSITYVYLMDIPTYRELESI